MSSLRRIVTAGLPTAGLTVLTALALSGAPAAAADLTAGAVARPVVAAHPAATPCADSDRGNCGYGATTETPGAVASTPTAAPATVPATTPTRGRPGYGTPAPSSPTPTGNTDTVPPGVSPSSVTPSTPAAVATTPGGGVSAGHALPVTGAPMGTVISVGVLMVAAGAASVWYTRRRRSA